MVCKKSTKINFITLLKSLETSNDNRSQLVKEISNLTKEEKIFIENKSKDLLTIDNTINDDPNISKDLNTTLKRLQFNVLSLFLLSKIKNPDCSSEIQSIINKFNRKISKINEILEQNLNRDISKSESQPSQPSQPDKLPTSLTLK